jgi:hypothetical protein
MRRILSLLAAVIVLMLAACVTTPSGSGSGGGGSAKSSAQTLEIDGHPVTLADLVKSPLIRPALFRYIQFDSLKSEAAKKGIKIDQAELDKAVEEQKTSVTESGQAWEEFLSQQGMTEAEFIDSARSRLLFQKLTEAMVVVTDKDAKDLWDKSKDQVINRYMTENHLPESDKAGLTFEKVKATALAMAKEEQGFSKQEEVINAIVGNATLKLQGFGTAEEDKLLYDLILGNAQAEVKKRLAEPKPGAPNLTVPGGQQGAPPAAQGGSEQQPPEKPSDGSKAKEPTK